MPGMVLTTNYLLCPNITRPQMLVVENRQTGEDGAAIRSNFNVDEFIWNHGITPPLKHVRKRRFRKRANRRVCLPIHAHLPPVPPPLVTCSWLTNPQTIETVEQEVERLFEADSLADDVKYDVLENVNPDLSDSEFIDYVEAPLDAPTPAFDAPTPATPADGADEDEDDGDMPPPAVRGGGGDEDDEGDGDIDEELAAELDLALGDEEGDEDDEDEDEDDEDDSDDDDDDDEETAQMRKLLNEEIQDLEAAVNKKRSEIASSANPLIKVSACSQYRDRAHLAYGCHAASVRGRIEEVAGRSRHQDGAKRRVEGESSSQAGGQSRWCSCRRQRRRRLRWRRR